MLFALGWREAIVVGTAVVLTLALTLFASWAMGFTLNRVSLFALIFSIGILVDDAIVVVENIHRHMRARRQALLRGDPAGGGRSRRADHPRHLHRDRGAAADGLRQRPDGARTCARSRSTPAVGMLLSLAVALVVTPWLCAASCCGRAMAMAERTGALRSEAHRRPACTPVRARACARSSPAPRRRGAGACCSPAMVGLVLAAAALVVVQLVVLKMLPFDNKSEFQVVVDMPEGATLERTNALLRRAGRASSTTCPKCATARATPAPRRR